MADDEATDEPSPTVTPTPSPTATPTPSYQPPPQDHYKVFDLSGKKRTAHLHGKIIDGGVERETSNFANLQNDITSVDEDNFIAHDHLEIRETLSTISTNALTIGCWVNFKGESALSSTIVGTNDDNNRCAFIVNANETAGDEEKTGMLGYTWGNHRISLVDGSTKWRYEDTMFDITIPKNKWTWLVLMIYPSGIARVFVDNVYSGSVDEGYTREILQLKNLEVGRFSGLIDSIYIFSDTIDFGGVQLGQDVTSELSYLYNTSRSDPFEANRPNTIQISQPSYGGIPFYYMQPDELVEANILYKQRTKSRVLNGELLNKVLVSQTQEMLDEQKYTISGGVNDGVRVYADDKFMTFPGEVKEMK